MELHREHVLRVDSNHVFDARALPPAVAKGDVGRMHLSRAATPDTIERRRAALELLRVLRRRALARRLDDLMTDALMTDDLMTRQGAMRHLIGRRSEALATAVSLDGCIALAPIRGSLV